MDKPGELREMAERLARGALLLDLPLTLQEYAATEVLIALKPTQGGMVMSQPYRGEPFDPAHSRVVKGGWDHEHCYMCFDRVLPGDDWWAASPPNQAGLCPDCHALLVGSGPAMRSAGLADLAWRGRGAARGPESAMTEAEWLSSTIPRAMLMTLEARPKAGEFNRKLRLFACACARRVWHLLEDERSRSAVEVAERYADGMATPEELDAAGHEATDAASDLYVSGGLRDADEARMKGEGAAELPAGAVFGEEAGERAWRAAKAADGVTRRKVGSSGTQGWYEGGAWVAAHTTPMRASYALATAAELRAREGATEAKAAAISEPLTATEPIAGAAEILMREEAYQAAIEAGRLYEDPWQADLLRCLFGNPHRPVLADPAWLTPASVAMARSIDEHRSFDLLPRLADELEGAGCRDASILGHCREARTHARGCWVVDMVLGKS